MNHQTQKLTLDTSNQNSQLKLISQSKSLNLSPTSPHLRVASWLGKNISTLQPTEKSAGSDLLKDEKTFQSTQRTRKLLKLENENLETIPRDFLKNYKNIQQLELENNKLRVIPKEIYELQELEHLNLNSNFIKLVPEEMYNHLPMLETLKIANNLINNISCSIQKWNNHLINLELGFNRLQNLKNICTLTELKTLKIQSNDFRTIPFSFQKLENLYELGLDWYKYINPAELPVQSGVSILKLLQFLKFAEFDQQNDDSVIQDDYCSDFDDGVNFAYFAQYFSTDNVDYNFIIRKAAFEQDIGVIVSMEKSDHKLIDILDNDKASLLSLCIQQEKYFSCKTLIELGVQVNKGKSHQGGILNLALLKGQIHVIIDLIYHKADPLAKDPNGNQALHYCMALFDKDIEVYSKVFTFIMKFGGQPNSKNNDGWAPLHLAIKKGLTEAVSEILNYNKTNKKRNQFDINLRGGHKKLTPLHIACLNGHIDITLMLLNCSEINLYVLNKDQERPHQLCYHHYKLHKIFSSYESQDKLKYLAEIVDNKKYNNEISDGDHSSVQEEELVLPYEIEEGLSLCNQKTYSICSSLWSDIILNSHMAINRNSSMVKSLRASPDRIIHYLSHLQQFYSRAKFESFKEDTKIMDKLYYLVIIFKSFIEIMNMAKQMKANSIQTPFLTVKHVIFCMIQLLQKNYQMNQMHETVISCPGEEGQRDLPKEFSRVNHFFPNEQKTRVNRFIQEKEEFSGSKQQGIQLSQQQPQIEVIQECPKSPTLSNNSSCKWDFESDDSNDGIRLITQKGMITRTQQKKSLPKKHALEHLYWSELLVKTQSSKLISGDQVLLSKRIAGQKDSTLAFEAFQSFCKLKKK